MRIQIAKKIFLMNLSTMKQILDLAQYKLGKESDDFKYFKKQTMQLFYDSLEQLFDSMVQENIIKKCSCKNKIKDGYSECALGCGGSGFINTI